jgi:hypothetical protein
VSLPIKPLPTHYLGLKKSAGYKQQTQENQGGADNGTNEGETQDNADNQQYQADAAGNETTGQGGQNGQELPDRYKGPKN